METLARAANRGSVPTGYDIDNSLKLESDNLETLYAVPWSTTGTRTTHTWSIWVKRTELGTRQMLFEGGTNNTVTTQLSLSFQTNDALEVRAGEFVPGSVAGTVYRLTNRVFRDTSAWYHIVAAFDTTQATANNRIKIWINGVQETSFATIANPAQNTDLGPFVANAQQTVGASGNNGFYYNGYVTHAALVYNQQLDADSFGEFDSGSGIWKPIDLENLTFGAFGFYLKFDNAAHLGADSSGNNYHFTQPNITSADQATDTPTNNFCTLNPLSAGGNQGNVITEGATKVVIESNGQQVAVGTIAVTKGKWYWEAKHTSGTHQFAGIISADSRVSGNSGVADASVAGSDAIALYRVNGQVYYLGVGTVFDTNSYTNGDIIGVALNMDNGTCALYKNGVLMGNAGSNDIVAKSGHASLTGAWTAMYSDGSGAVNITYEVNFGGYHTYSISSGNTDANGYGTFEYAPPSGYYALCTKNLAEYG